MTRAVALISGLAAVAFLVLFAQLGAVEGASPRQADVNLPGGIPGTLYLPGTNAGYGSFADAPPRDQRPPGVVLVHGFAGDRVAMSSTARRMAAVGYAALTIDLQGHGQNRNPFLLSRSNPDNFYPALAEAVSFLRTSPHVDGTRIAVMGQSMGAGAALDFGTRDSGIDAVIMMSGGWSMMGPYRPPNALFIFAEFDPERIRARSTEMASRLAGLPAKSTLEQKHLYGDLSRGTGVKLVQVPGTDHATIIWSDFANREVLGWLDQVFERNRAGSDPPPDPRMGLLVWIGVAMLFVLPGLGLLVGRVLPSGVELSGEGRPLGLLALALALIAAMPLLSLGAPGAIISLEVADVLVSHFALAGIALLVLLALRENVSFGSLFRSLPPALPGAALGMIGIYLMLAPLGVFLHRLALTPERFAAFAMATAGLLPFSLALQLLLRRGPPLTAGLYALAGRAVVLAVMLAGIHFGALASVLMFMIGPLFGILLLVELLAASIYTRSRNPVAIALIDATSLALVLAAIMPIKF